MAKPSFISLLDAAPTEIERPKAMPEGSYLWVVQGLPRIDKSTKKGTEFTEFTLRCIQAGPDVDQEELEAMGGIQDKTSKATFYHTDGSIYRLDEFHEACGIDISTPATRRTRSEECQNCQVVGYIKHEASNDGTTIFGRLSKYAAAEDFGQEQEAA